MTITLKRSATCKQCGASLAVGSQAKWYRNGDVYGIGCHERKDTRNNDRSASAEDWACSDTAYEDRCADAVNGRW